MSHHADAGTPDDGWVLRISEISAGGEWTLDDMIAGIERILSGEATGRKEHTFAGDGLRCDFVTCGIVYRPDRL